MDPWLSSNTRIHDPVSPGERSVSTASVNIISFAPTPRATHSDLFADNVKHLCTLLAQLMTAPPRVKAVPEDEPLSFALSAFCLFVCRQFQPGSLYILYVRPKLLIQWRCVIIF